MAVGLSFAVLVGCWPGRNTGSITLNSPFVPVGFKLDSGTKYCRFGSLRFAIDYEYDSTFTRERTLELLKECILPIADTKFVSEAILRPGIAAADASLRFSKCVASKASTHLAVDRVQVGINTSDWGRC